MQTKDRSYTDKDGNKKEAVNVDFGGVYPFGHEKLPVEYGGRRGAKAAEKAAAAEKPAAKPAAKSAGKTPPRMAKDINDLI